MQRKESKKNYARMTIEHWKSFILSHLNFKNTRRHKWGFKETFSQNFSSVGNIPIKQYSTIRIQAHCKKQS
jgi:hypothetical protein